MQGSHEGRRRQPWGGPGRACLVFIVRALPDARLHLWHGEPGGGAPEAAAGHADGTGPELPQGLTACLCGPVPFMRAVRGDLLRRGVPAEAVHNEVFGPGLWLGQR
ncbi:hypothetical protein GCM10010279_27070 [Streptomyces mutabilis]|nr:hypothetical protein GCM10010279_27070 [Streptomyces mutabilis]